MVIIFVLGTSVSCRRVLRFCYAFSVLHPVEAAPAGRRESIVAIENRTGQPYRSELDAIPKGEYRVSNNAADSRYGGVAGLRGGGSADLAQGQVPGQQIEDLLDALGRSIRSGMERANEHV